MHARRRRPRGQAVAHARAYVRILSPLLESTGDDLLAGLDLFEASPRLGAFDAVLAATVVREGAALVSADHAFAEIDGLRHLDPASPTFLDDLGIS